VSGKQEFEAMPATSALDDTIAAISTAHGTGAIGIVRISGSGAFAIAGAVFRGKKKFEQMKTHTVAYGFIVDAPGMHGEIDKPGAAGATSSTSAIGTPGAAGPISAAEKIDEVLILKMEAPRTYTREDVVEIHCHAGVDVQMRVLRLVLRCGARAAEPGEFTKRAFLNGRLDLSQAEAVMDLIGSSSETGTKAALKLLEGELGALVSDTRERLLALIASLDVFLDFPEHDTEQRSASDARGALSQIEARLLRLSDSYSRGRVAREGIVAVIAGKPNVGKSTLLNALSGRERAIVTDVPGTTRDTIDEYVNLGGFTVRFVDTAGIRDTSDAVEKIGVAKTLEAVESADLAIAVFDAGDSGPQAAQAAQTAQAARCAREQAKTPASGHARASESRLLDMLKAKRIIAVINKTDLADERGIGALREMVAALFGGRPVVVEASLKDSEGSARAAEAIGAAIKRLFYSGSLFGGGEVILTNERHHALIQKCLASVRSANAALLRGLPPEMPIIDMEEALAALGEITGETYSNDVIDRIFADFCVGK
jgi:tRNA modification GTPase